MKIQKLFTVVLLILTTLFVANVVAKQAKSEKKAQLCRLAQEPGFMNSWFGQPGTPDHSESRPIKAGNWLGCWAEAAQGSSVSPACFLTYQNGGSYTLPSRTAMNSPTSDVVTLICNGQAPTCCKVQIAGGLAELKKKTPDIKVLEAKDAQK